MFGRKAKPLPQPVRRDRRQSQAVRPASPAFSYYTSRTPDNAAPRNPGGNQSAADVKTPPKRRRIGAQLPLVLLLAVVIVCLLKLVVLGTDPKVVVLGKSAVASTYLRSGSVYQSAAQTVLASSVTNRTKLTANLDGTAADLQTQFPELDAVSVTLPLIGNRPIIYVQVAQPSVILQTTHGNYALNKSGLVLAKVTTLPSGIPLAVDQSGSSPVPGKQYLPGSTVSFIQTLSGQLSAAKLQVAAFVFPAHAPYELDVRLEGKGFVVRCNLQAEALTQSGAIIATVQQLGTHAPADYLDVRVPGRVYYK
jgi:hypothetical protein